MPSNWQVFFKDDMLPWVLSNAYSKVTMFNKFDFYVEYSEQN
jgi:hypothetical protein